MEFLNYLPDFLLMTDLGTNSGASAHKLLLAILLDFIKGVNLSGVLLSLAAIGVKLQNKKNYRN